MLRQSHLEHLASVSLFSTCTKKELQAVARSGDELVLPAGKVLCQQGTLGREAFVIIAGTAEVRRNDKKVATVGPGTCVGELALLDHGPRTATVVAESEVTALVIGVREFASIIDEVPSISHKLLRALAGRIRDLDTQIYG
jgi:CRP/FNR family transcriptional regulator, cyclic AMP receptor protein